MNIVIIAHYYPPINSSGGKRAEALSKYLTVFGHTVTVITTTKSLAHGNFTEATPAGVNLVELDWLGRDRASDARGNVFEPLHSNKPSWRRRAKDITMDWLGQIPDPRLFFSLAFLSPWLARRAKSAILDADVVIGTTPPWPMILASLICKIRFGKFCILDYRDQFSDCHEMPGGAFAKYFEKKIDSQIAKRADRVVCISEPMAKYYSTMSCNVATILNGYDHELIDEARKSRIDVKNKSGIIIRYMGLVSPGRVPYNIMQALQILKKKNIELFDKISIEFYGDSGPIIDALSGKYSDISKIFSFKKSVPYIDSLRLMVDADYLMFSETSSNKTLSAQGILTTKLFEYVGSGRPILGDISDVTLAGSLLVKCGKRNIVGQSSDIFLAAFERNDFYVRQPDLESDLIVSLSRKSQARQYEALLSDCVG